jgi:hypothetical protein
MEDTTPITEIEMDDGTLYVDTEARESIFVRRHTPDLCTVSFDDSTCYIDMSTGDVITVPDADRAATV